MFILLDTEFYTIDGDDIVMTEKMIEMLLIVTVELAKYVKSVKDPKKADWKKTCAEEYNIHIVTNAKKILCDKLFSRSSQTELYL